MARSTRFLIGCTMVVSASACGGGGGGGGGQGGNVATLFSIDFPPGHSMTSADTVTLKGSTTNGSEIASLQVNNVQAATTNGFDTWTATVPLPVATNALSAVAIDRSGRAIGPIERIVELSTPPVSPQKPAVDPNRRRILLGQGNRDPFGLVALDVPTGRFVAVSGPTRGSGAPIEGFLLAFTVDAAADVAYGIEFLPTRILEIDLATGDRRTISDDSNAGPLFDFPTDLDLDLARNRLLVVDRDLDAVIAVDLADGTRTILSDDAHGSGPPLDLPESLHVVASQGRALIADILERALI